MGEKSDYKKCFRSSSTFLGDKNSLNIYFKKTALNNDLISVIKLKAVIQSTTVRPPLNDEKKCFPVA